NFRFSVFAIQRVQLPVGIRDADLVGVDQGEPAHARSCQRLGGPRADAADADHADVLLRERLHAAKSVQAFDAGKALDPILVLQRCHDSSWLRQRCILSRRLGFAAGRRAMLAPIPCRDGVETMRVALMILLGLVIGILGTVNVMNVLSERNPMPKAVMHTMGYHMGELTRAIKAN